MGLTIYPPSTSSQLARGMLSPGSFSTTETTLQEALSTSGKGALKGLMLTGATSGIATVRITVDGNVVIWSGADTSSGGTYTLSSLWYTLTQTGTVNSTFTILAADSALKSFDLSYKTSLLIELASNNVSYTESVYWVIEEE